jgi:hypothetical protein
MKDRNTVTVGREYLSDRILVTREALFGRLQRRIG